MDIKFKDNSKLKLAPFTQLEYIESTGTQYIDTGIFTSSNIGDITFTYQFIGNAKNFVFGNVADPGPYLGYRSDKIWWGSGINISVLNENKHSVIYKNSSKVVSLDGNSLASGFSQISGTAQKTLLLFAERSDRNVINKGSVRIFNFSIFNITGDFLLNLIPVKDSDDVVCLYDTVTKTFFYNQGTGDFVAGQIAHSTTVSLPEPILLKTTTLYHKNTPNVDGLQLLNSILNYQKTHQEEVKEYYYPTTQLWQDIVTEYPDILYWYNIDHKFCIYICEADDPEQCAQDFLAASSSIQQELEDYPDLIPLIAEYPSLASIIAEYPSLTPIVAEYPSLTPIIAENPTLAPIIAENPEVVHSLIDTGYETWLQADGSSWIVTNYYINGNTDVECRACILNYNQSQNASPMLYGGAQSYQGIGGEMYGWAIFTFNYYNSTVTFTTSQVPINVKFKAETTAGLINISLDSGTTLTGGSSSRLTFTASVPTVVFALNRGSVDFKSATSKLSSLKFKEGAENKLWLVPIQNNGNPCMIDLLTGTKYLNQGTGSFTYSLEPKNA